MNSVSVKVCKNSLSWSWLTFLKQSRQTTSDSWQRLALVTRSTAVILALPCLFHGSKVSRCISFVQRGPHQDLASKFQTANHRSLLALKTIEIF